MPLARFKRAYKYASKELEAALQRVDRAYQAAQSELKELTRKHKPKAGAIADTILEGEVRTYLWGLDELERIAELQKAANTGDVVTLRAAILAPPILLPLPEDVRDLLQAGYAKATDPKGVARARELQEGIERTLQGGASADGPGERSAALQSWRSGLFRPSSRREGRADGRSRRAACHDRAAHGAATD
jgi:hypothetical protein